MVRILGKKRGIASVITAVIYSALRPAVLVSAVLVPNAGFAGEEGEGARKRFRPLQATDQGMRTGPGVGEKVPSFTNVDHRGTRQSLADLTGKKGLVLLFVRSADW